LTQEVKLLSAIGLSTKESELNDALRETRQKHATEINFWRQKVSELELNLAQYEHEQRAISNMMNGRQPTSHDVDVEAQTSFDLEAELIEERERHYSEKAIWKRHLASLEIRLQVCNLSFHFFFSTFSLLHYCWAWL